MSKLCRKLKIKSEIWNFFYQSIWKWKERPSDSFRLALDCRHKMFQERKCQELFLELLRVLFIYLPIKVIFQLSKPRRIRPRYRVTQQRHISSQEVACPCNKSQQNAQFLKFI